MKLHYFTLGAVLFAIPLSAQNVADSTAMDWERRLELEEIVVVASRPVVKQAPDRIIYLTKNDQYAKGMNGMEVLDRIPRVSVVNDLVTVAGKNSVRYIIDGRLMEISDEAMAMRLKNLQASGIEKIEVLTTPPAKYAAGNNVAYISITSRNESLGTRGNVWANGSYRESFCYQVGGNVSHSTRKVELSADASWNDSKGINDLDRTYTFADHIKTSNRSTDFTNRNIGANGLFKYKFTENLNAGVILNYYANRLNSNLVDVTTDRGVVFKSTNWSPSRPNNALTVTAFTDWMLDSKGKMLSFTYNYFDKRAQSFSDVTTSDNDVDVRLTNTGDNKYHIHSAKLDAILPFRSFRMEAGLAFTSIGNNATLDVHRRENNSWILDAQQSNAFDYDENSAVAYMSVERNFTNSLFGKLGLRYESTRTKGYQRVSGERNSDSYNHLFPTLNFSWNSQNAGRLSASYSMGITRPNFNDLNPYKYYTTTSDYVSGNPDLQPSIAHNAEISYSFKGIYAVLYNSYNNDAIGYITRFNTDGSQFTIPENHINSNKTGLYASYYRSLFGWWNLNLGGEVFHTYAKSKLADYRNDDDSGWSGKVELSTSFMLNRQKSLVLDVRFNHYFPYHERMIRYEAMSLFGCSLRYSLLNDRLTLTASVSDPFGWNVTKSTAIYHDYSVYTRNDIHAHSVSFRISYSFGRSKVNNVYRDTKERESNRAN